MYNILLVDDEKNEREGIKFLISKYNFKLNIFEASNGKEALEVIEKQEIDILLTDIIMPFIGGLELSERVNLLYEDIIIIIFSAHGEFEYAKKAMENNALSYLLKPIEVEEFMLIMNSAIEKCDENRRKKGVELERKNLSEKQILYYLLTNSNDKNISAERIYKELHFKNMYRMLIHVETQNGLFSFNEEGFLKIVSNYLTMPYKYINIYSDSSFIIIESSEVVKGDDIKALMQKVGRDMAQLLDAKYMIIIGNCFSDIQEMHHQAYKINEINSTVFQGEMGVMQLSDFSIEQSYYTEAIDRCRKDIMLSIEKDKMNEVPMQIKKLLLCLKNSKAISVVYIHYIFYDIINKLYKSQGFDDKNLVQERIDSVVRSNNVDEMGAAFKLILDETSDAENELIAKGIAWRVIRIIETEYAKELSLDYIAQKVHFSPAYLSFLFKQETGYNITEKLFEYRMSKAKEMLLSTNERISEVARKCGYKNPSYFNRIFKSINSYTPKQYRERKR